MVVLLAVQTAAGAAPGDAVYSAPGTIEPAADGARLNFYCMGAGSPTVIFESGWEDWAPAWAVVQPQVAKWTRACSYDRAGAGFSGPGPMPRTSVRIAEELHGALHHAGITGPYILVGNAFGGDPARTFAALYTAELAGLVLVEADASDLEPKAMQDDDHRANARTSRGCARAAMRSRQVPRNRRLRRGPDKPTARATSSSFGDCPRRNGRRTSMPRY